MKHQHELQTNAERPFYIELFQKPIVQKNHRIPIHYKAKLKKEAIVSAWVEVSLIV